MVKNNLKNNKENDQDLAQKGYIFDIQKFSIHDGPGIRTLIFLKGCHLSCKWCSNPEGQNLHQEIFYFNDMCVFCGKCESICHLKKKKLSKKLSIYNKVCMINCSLECCNVCIRGAMVKTGYETDVKSVLESVLKDQDYYYISNGGVTISGGEPFYQTKFLLSLVRIIKYYYINLCVETCGYFNYKESRELLKYIDSFLYDLKLIDSEKHKQYTGVDNNIILDNLIKLIDAKKKVTVRIPIIPGINNNNEELNKFIDFLKPIYSQLDGINIIPYHEYGIGKYKRLGRKYELNIRTLKNEDIKILEEKFSDSGIDVTVMK
jgi:pyruvate formate lyase activating enzyme